MELYSYAEFDSIDNKDQYRLMDMSAKCGNRDGAALRYVSERLMSRPEAIKLLIIISDGQPAGDNYYGTEAEADLRGIKRNTPQKGSSCSPPLSVMIRRISSVSMEMAFGHYQPGKITREPRKTDHPAGKAEICSINNYRKKGQLHE